MSWAHLFFHWPDGGVWSNIVASLIWASPTILVASVRVKHHINALHAKIDHHHERLEELHRKIDAVHEHLGIGK